MFACAILLSLAPPTSAQTEEDPPAVLLIMDSSGSMNASDGAGSTKIAGAKAALTELVDQMPDDAMVGLRVYGHRIPNTDKTRGCQDTELIVPVRPLERAVMKERIRSFDAKGFTPIGRSLEEAAKDLPERGNRTIVLVSDGIDTCAPPPPCLVARRLKQQGIDVRIDTIGFQVNPKARRQLRCIARVGGGTYSDARSSDELADRLNRSSLRALRTFEVTGTPVTGTPDETDAPIITTGGYTDTISADEERWYRLELAEGQSLRVAATVISEPRPGLTRLSGLLARVVSADAGQVDVDVGQHPVGEPVTAQVELGPVGSSPELPPGTYYLYLSLRQPADAQAQDLSVELVVEVFAEIGTPTAAPTETAAPPAPASTPPAGSGSPAAPVWGSLIAAAAGLLAGAFGSGRFLR